MKRIVLQSQAKAELYRARLWYDEQRQGLGQDLLDEVLAALEKIERNNSIGLRYENTRYPFYAPRTDHLCRP